jgi:tetratricopeptide (TPR) repeat protein
VLEERAKARDLAANTKAPTESLANQKAQRQKRADEWKRIGALAFLDNTDRAISAYQQALTFAPNDAAILDQLGELYSRQARWNERISVGERLVGLEDPEAQTKGLFNIADSYLEEGQPSKARPSAERCVTIARSAKVSRFESRCLSLLAGASAQEQNFVDAERVANQALTIARSGGYDYEAGMALYILAVTGEQRVATMPPADRRKALQDVDRIYEQLEHAGPAVNDPAAAAAVMVNRGRVALALGDFATAESRLRKALASMEGSRTTGRISYVEQELGRALVAQNRINEAIPYFSSSVQKAREAKEPGYEAVALMAWAAAEASRSNRSEACRLAQESYRVYVEGVPELRAVHQRAEQQVKQFCR